MKALSLQQPWAAAVALGVADVINRRWETSFRGRFLIHASMRLDGAAGWVRNELQSQASRSTSELATLRRALTPGAIIGVVRLTGCSRESSSCWAVAGEAHWSLADACLLPRPEPCRGYQGFWDPPQGARVRIGSQFQKQKDAASVAAGAPGEPAQMLRPPANAATIQRRTDCPVYNRCLAFVVAKRWEAWSCGGCTGPKAETAWDHHA